MFWTTKFPQEKEEIQRLEKGVCLQGLASVRRDVLEDQLIQDSKVTTEPTWSGMLPWFVSRT